jgi:polysaccharide biosynthesis protein PslG
MNRTSGIVLAAILVFTGSSAPSSGAQRSTAKSSKVKAAEAAASSQVVQDNVGIMVHRFDDTNLDRVVQAGFGVVRLDLEWGAVEEVKGQYNWSEYDAIINRLKARNLRPLFILDFNNPLYGEGSMDGIDTPEEREGFKSFSVAAVNRYQQRMNPMWEIYNEPNRPTFWSDPSAEEYVNLVKTVVPAMRQAQPNLFIMGPGLGHAPAADPDNPVKVDFGYLESTFALGILGYVDAVSIHPYPDGPPELVFNIYDDVRYLMKMYAAPKDVAIVSSEWGYSTAASYSNSETLQADFLTRMYLINLSQRVLSVGYKLEYGSPAPDADAYELGYSWFKSSGEANLVYKQIQSMIGELKGLSFSQRLPSVGTDYFLEFSNGTKTVIAAWTSENAHAATVYGKSVRLTGKPIYVTT